MKYSVSLEKVINSNGYEVLYTPTSPSDIYISSKDINRPGLILAGYEDYFDPERIQLLGFTEIGYLNSLSVNKRQECLEKFLSTKPVAIIITRNLEPVEGLLSIAEKYNVPILRTSDDTSGNMASLIAYLGVELADRITRHGVLVEVLGEGVLIVGDSGVGKSETAVELIKRGHRLIADDAVEIRKISSNSLSGTAPALIRNYVEMRGIGVINVAKLFGMGAVKAENEINLVVNIVPWNNNVAYDRLGVEENFMEILGVKIPMNTIPVTPGRNLAVILEVAAMNNRQRKMGYNPALEFTEQISRHYEESAGQQE